MRSLRKASEASFSDPVAYPFSAIVGQKEMKLALLLSVVDPLLGGVLIMGHRGTAKSTAVRGLASLLPQIRVVRGCPIGCDPTDHRELCSACQSKIVSGQKLQSVKIPVPVVDLPLGATEDRVCGTIDIERALTKGERAFEPGLLARANRGLLYIDEVNLLDDHLVDLLLDVSVTGRNKVEREGISIEHASRFVLIGSGNPEEGELRPQLLDRFGLHVEVSTETDVDRRVEIVQRRELFERNREKFCEGFQEEELRLRRDLTRAQKGRGSVKIESRLVRKVVELCSKLNVDGHRGELTITRAARALAALENRRKVTESDVRRVSAISLRHRLRRGPFEETGGTQQIEQTLDTVFGDGPSYQPKKPGDDDHTGNGGPAKADADGRHRASNSDKNPATRPAESNLKPATNGLDSDFEPVLKFDGQSASSRRNSSRRRPFSKCISSQIRGRYSRAVAHSEPGSLLAVDATIRAFALESGLVTFDSSQGETRRRISSEHFRYKEFTRKAGYLFLLTIDTSGSMAKERIEKARRVVLAILSRSYLRRDAVALVVFRGDGAELALPPSQSTLRAKRTLNALAIGGGTPLSAGISQALQTAKRAKERFGNVVILVFTDGGANVPVTREGSDPTRQRAIINAELSQLGGLLKMANVNAVVLDTQNRFTRNGQARDVAERLHAEYIQI